MGTDTKREFCSYDHMKQRCLNPNNEKYENYGGRGIKVCDQWLGKDGFRVFLEDMGPRPSGCTLDRIDVNGDYCPENCRWANLSLQMYNQRPKEHSTKSTGVSLSYRGKNKRPIYVANITKDYKLFRKEFRNYMDALIWRAKKEVEFFGDDSLQTDKLIALIVDWGRQRRIANPEKQFIKVVEEVAEIGREIVRGNYDNAEIQDAIGDSLITLIILSDILGFNPMDKLEASFDVIRGRTGKTVDGCFVKEEDIKEA